MDLIPEPAPPNWKTTWTLWLGIRDRASSPLRDPVTAVEVHKSSVATTISKCLRKWKIPPNLLIEKVTQSSLSLFLIVLLFSKIYHLQNLTPEQPPFRVTQVWDPIC